MPDRSLDEMKVDTDSSLIVTNPNQIKKKKYYIYMKLEYA